MNTCTLFQNVLVAMVLALGGGSVISAEQTTSVGNSDQEKVIQPVKEKKWGCKAPNLVTFRYSGGDNAYIHLSPYSYGGDYRVTKNGITATGETANGTTFVCKEE